MTAGVLTADDSTDFIEVTSESTHVSYDGDFGGGTIAIEKRVSGATFPIHDLGVPITSSIPDDVFLGLSPGDEIRITLTGATSPTLTWSITTGIDP